MIRTARDWRDGIRKIRNTRVLPDGTVIHYTTGTRYTQPVTTTKSPVWATLQRPNQRAGSCRCRIDSRSPTVWLPSRR